MAETIQCRNCNGSGAEMNEHDDHPAGETCWACAPTGMIETECYYCDGSGQVVVCEHCEGKGCFMCEMYGYVKA